MPAPQDPFQTEPDRRRRLAQFGLVKGSLIAGVVLLVGGFIFAGVVGGNGGQALGILGFVFSLTAFIIAAAFYYYAAKWQRVVDAMVAGDHFAHWVYSTPQWEAHLDGEKKRRGRLWLLLGGIMGASGVLICLFASFDDKITGQVLAITWLALGGGMALLGVVIGWAIELVNRRRDAWMRTKGGEVFIGPQGVYISGTYWPWKVYGQRLTSAEYREPVESEVGERGTSKPAAHLVFTFYINTGKGSYTREVFVPIPYGKEVEAKAVLAQVHDR